MGIPVSGWQTWLYDGNFYKVAWVYMNARIVVNVSQVFLAFYVLDTLRLPTVYITIVPCVVYLSSFLAALAMRRVNKPPWAARSSPPSAACSASSPWCCSTSSTRRPPTSSTCPPSSSASATAPSWSCRTQLEADLIGRKTEHGAFVYGALSFTDKLANGVLIFVLQVGNADLDAADEVATSDSEYIRGVWWGCHWWRRC